MVTVVHQDAHHVITINALNVSQATPYKVQFVHHVTHHVLPA